MSGFVGQVGAKSGKIGHSAISAMFSGKLKSIQEFSSPGAGTWTKPAGITHIMVYCTGGGGAGGGGGSGNQDIGGGGGSGGTAIRFYDVKDVASCTIFVGARGTTPVGGNASGGNATSSTFAGPGATITGTGGGGGYHGNAGGVRGGSLGSASGGNMNINGMPGDPGCDDPGGQWHPPGLGGSAFWGGAGQIDTQNEAAGTPSVYGAGGGGNSSGQTDNWASNGYIVVYEYA